MTRWLWRGASILLITGGVYELRSLIVYLWVTDGGNRWTLFAPGAYEALRTSSLVGAPLFVLGVAIGIVSLFWNAKRRSSRA